MNYLAACLFLYFSHAIPSAPAVRTWLFDRLGARIFRLVYSSLSTVGVIWFVWAYSVTDVAGSLFAPLPGAAVLATVFMPAALYLMIGRLSTPLGELENPAPPTGVYKITRFPGSLGVLLWALLHLSATGDVKRVMAFGIFALIAVTALVKNERVLKRQSSQAAKVFLEATSLVPFGKISGGPQGIALMGLGWKRPLAALVLYGMLIGLHPVLLAVDPLAWIR